MNDTRLDRVVRLRPDIQWSEFSGGSRTNCVARDPISLQYFYFSKLERTLADLLDGSRSLAEILQLPAANSISKEWLLTFIHKLDSSCLTIVRGPSQAGKRLWLTRRRQRHHEVWQRWLSPLMIRVKLFDPSHLLELLSPVAGFMFGKVFVGFWLLAVSSVGCCVALHLLQTPHGLAATLSQVTAERGLVLGLLYVCVKSLHELGHALACKKWGAECHEIGVFFLAFMPCLYCDTSDSWKLQSSWRRACIAAAGIYVELSIAALSGMVWLLSSEHSMLHWLAANLMLICSVSTFFVNANPLLRYDGYYVLSDVWGVPNLHEQSGEALMATGVAWATGKRVPHHRWDAGTGWLSLYALSAWCYRHVVIFVIAWAVWTLLDQSGLHLMGAVLVALLLVNVLLVNVRGGLAWSRQLKAAGGLRGWRGGLAAVLVGLTCIAFFCIPWPTHVSSRGVAAYAKLTPVYAEQSGILVEFKEPGSHLAQGSQIASLASTELELELSETQGVVALLEQRSAQLSGRLVDDDQAARELATVIQELSKSRERLKILEVQFESLISRARHAGVLLPGQHITLGTLTDLADKQIPKQILSAENVGCFVERGTLLAWIRQVEVADCGAFEAIAYVDESHARLLSVGLAAICRWDCYPSLPSHGMIVRIAPEPISEIPEMLLGDESIPYRVDGEAKLRPVTAHYEVQLSFDQLPTPLNHQSLGTLHFEIPPQTLYQSLRRFLTQSMHPRL